MKRALILLALGFAMVAGMGTGQAQADTYCAELPADTSCDQNFTGLSSSIQDAVEAADENPGPDSVKVGPGVFVMPSPVYLSSFGDDNRLTLTGAGNSTVLTSSDPENPDIHFNGPQGSSINSLTVSIPDDAGNESKIGLALDSGTTGNQLNVTFASHLTSGDPSGAQKTVGVRLVDGATLRNSTVRLYSSNVNDAVNVFGSGTVIESSLTAFRDVYQRNATGIVEVRRSALIPLGGAGGLTTGGTMNIRDSVIVNPFGGNGVYASSLGTATNMLIDGTTMVGTAGSTGAVIVASHGNPNPANTSFQLNSSLVYGFDFAVAYSNAFPEDTLNLGVDSSAYDATRFVRQLGETGTPHIDIEGLVDINGIDPGFMDPGNGDYSLAAGSPLIDKGQAAAPPAGSKDLSGNPRACHGPGTGVIRRDIGAYELRTNPADDCTYPETIITSGPELPPARYTSKTLEFGIASSKANSTFQCSIDGGTESACGSKYTTPDPLSVGYHTFGARAVDQFGNVDQTPITQMFGLDIHGPGPGGDLTAPKVVGLKAPKKTKAKRVKVRFRSNETKVTFTCRLNRSKPKRCKSPWKTPKLKKGKNTVQVWATDPSGNRSGIRKLVIKRR